MIPLVEEIKLRSGKFIALFNKVPESKLREKNIPFTWGNISTQDLLAYQIGWGSLLIEWYHNGLDGKEFVMPGEGFTKWDYQGLANHFFQKYRSKQIQDFITLVQTIIDIAKKEHIKGRLSPPGAFAWCTLSSGKHWALEKWIRVNTCAPYKRAAILLKKI